MKRTTWAEILEDPRLHGEKRVALLSHKEVLRLLFSVEHTGQDGKESLPTNLLFS